MNSTIARRLLYNAGWAIPYGFDCAKDGPTAVAALEKIKKAMIEEADGCWTTSRIDGLCACQHLLGEKEGVMRRLFEESMGD